VVDYQRAIFHPPGYFVRKCPVLLSSRRKLTKLQNVKEAAGSSAASLQLDIQSSREFTGYITGVKLEASKCNPTVKCGKPTPIKFVINTY
jgi:hypothetical protein